jgi:dipeptidyl aminopeptidase/acylaminoacyl peptidase
LRKRRFPALLSLLAGAVALAAVASALPAVTGAPTAAPPAASGPSTAEPGAVAPPLAAEPSPVARTAAATLQAAAPAAGAAADLESAVARMARIGSCTAPSFSPDGSRIVFVSNLTGVPQVWTVAAEGGFPRQVTALEDQVIGVQWSPDGRWIGFSLAPGGGMNSQIYLVRPDGLGLARLTAGGKDNNWFGGFSEDGGAIAFSSNRAGTSMDGYLLDLGAFAGLAGSGVPAAPGQSAPGEPRRVVVNPGTGNIEDLSADRRLALVSRVASRGDGDVYLVEIGEDGGGSGGPAGRGKAREWRLTPHQGPGTFGNARFSPDGRTVYLAADKDRDRVAFARVRLSAGPAGFAPGPVEVLAGRDDAELNGFELAHDGSFALLVWNVDGRDELAFYDVAAGRMTPGPELPGELVGGFDVSRDGRRVALALSGSTRPSDIWVLDRASGRLTQVTESPHPGVDLGRLMRPELVRFTADDGLALSGWLYRPRDAAGPAPFVLSFHGGPEAQERPGFRSEYQALLSRGIGVFAPNVRGSSGFGKRFVNLDNGALRAGSVRDIKAAADYLTSRGLAEAGRLGIMGGSYGGYMTMAGLADYPDLFAAGANLYGVVNFETFFSHTEPWMAAISKVEYGDPDSERGMLRELSPIHRIDRVRAATLVLHGANDTNVPVVEAEQVVESLKRRGVPVEYVLFPDEGHGFRKIPNRIRSTVAIVRWFEEHLKS